MSVFLRNVVLEIAAAGLPMSVGMRVLFQPHGRERFGNPPHYAGQIQNSQKNQHQADRQFHREPDSRRDHEAEQNNRQTNHENRNRVPQSPKDANKSCVLDTSLPADDCCYSDDVVRIRRVAHAEKKPKSDDGK